MSDRSQRTEKPTPQRLRKARTEGRFASSKDFVSAVQFAVGVALMAGLVDRWWPAALEGTRAMLASAFTIQLDQSVVTDLLRERLAPAFLPLLAAGGAMFCAVMLGAVVSPSSVSQRRALPQTSPTESASKLRELPARLLRGR